MVNGEWKKFDIGINVVYSHENYGNVIQNAEVQCEILEIV